jgi:hypothetical protein
MNKEESRIALINKPLEVGMSTGMTKEEAEREVKVLEDWVVECTNHTDN